jgi:hypothetical protein
LVQQQALDVEDEGVRTEVVHEVEVADVNQEEVKEGKKPMGPKSTKKKSKKGHAMRRS